MYMMTVLKRVQSFFKRPKAKAKAEVAKPATKAAEEKVKEVVGEKVVEAVKEVVKVAVPTHSLFEIVSDKYNTFMRFFLIWSLINVKLDRLRDKLQRKFLPILKRGKLNRSKERNRGSRQE